MSKFMKISPLGAELCPCGQTDGRTDMTKLPVPFRNFAKTPKNKEGKSDPLLPDMEP